MRASNPSVAAAARRSAIGPLAAGLVGLLMTWGCFGTSEKEIKQAEIQYDLGVNELRTGRIREAMDNFMQAIDLNPDMAQAHNGLGLALHFLGRNEQALEQFEKALELKPKYSEVLNNMARVYLSQNRYREAIPFLKKALKDVFLPERYLAESNLGWALFQIGRREEGMQHVMNALAENERYCVGYEYLGLMYQEQKKYPEAVREFSQLLETCPDYLTGHLDLAKVLLMVGQVELGCQHLATCSGRHRMSPIGRKCDRLFRASCSRQPPADQH